MTTDSLISRAEENDSGASLSFIAARLKLKDGNHRGACPVGINGERGFHRRRCSCPARRTTILHPRFATRAKTNPKVASNRSTIHFYAIKLLLIIQECRIMFVRTTTPQISRANSLSDLGISSGSNPIISLSEFTYDKSKTIYRE